jgi:hypothetical protein
MNNVLIVSAGRATGMSGGKPEVTARRHGRAGSRHRDQGRQPQEGRAQGRQRRQENRQESQARRRAEGAARGNGEGHGDRDAPTQRRRDARGDHEGDGLASAYNARVHQYPREVWVVDTGTTCDQTGFMRKKLLQAMVGFCIVEVHRHPRGGVNRFRPEFLPFYDRGFYGDKRRTFS